MESYLADSKVWVALSFTVFLLAFMRFATPAILKALDSRSDNIKDELEQAVRLRESAQALLADYQKKQKEMKAQAEHIVELARKEAAVMRSQAEEALRDTVERRTRQAHDKIARAESEALADIQSMIVDLSVKASHELLSQQLDDTQREKLASGALDQLKQLRH